MVNQSSGAGFRNWEIKFLEKIDAILEIDDFIFNHSEGASFLETREIYYKNYIHHLITLYDNNQLLVQRDEEKKIIAVLGWLEIEEDDEYKVNKIRWTFPQKIKGGDILYVTFCVIRQGDIYDFKRKLREMIGDKIKEICWFNLSQNKFVRRQNLYGRTKNVEH